MLEDLVSNQGLFVINTTQVIQNHKCLPGTGDVPSKHLLSRCNTYPGINKIITIGGMNSDCRMPVAR